jgi:hypothetical protein
MECWGRVTCLVIVIIFLTQCCRMPAQGNDSRVHIGPLVEPYIEALECVETNGTLPCNNQDASLWPHNATIYQRGSQIGETEAVVKLRMEGKGDPIKKSRPQQVILVTDDSGAMRIDDPTDIRFNATKVYVDQLQVPDEIGFVVYADRLPNGQYSELRSNLTTDYQSTKKGMYGNSSGNDSMIYGLKTANDELIPKKKPGFTWAIIHLTNGCWDTGGDPQSEVNRMANEQIMMYNIGLYPDPSSPDKAKCEPYLQKWSQQTGGKYYWIQNPDDLAQIYKDIGYDLFYDTAGTSPKTGEPMITFQLTNNIEVVPNSFGGSVNYTPTYPVSILPGNSGLRLEWKAPIKELHIKQIWDVFFRIRSYGQGKNILVDDLSKSFIRYDRYDGFPGGSSQFSQLTLEVLPSSFIQYPSITSTYPIEGTTNVSVNTKMSFTWNKVMNQTSAENAFSSSPSVMCVWSWNNLTQICTPTVSLQNSKRYIATISTMAKDTSGNAMKASFTLNFSTELKSGTIPPIVTGTYPADNDTNIPTNTSIIITFSESMDKKSAEDAFSSSPLISCTWSWIGLNQSCTLIDGLQSNTKYTITISTSAKDLAGNAMQKTYTFSFTTKQESISNTTMSFSLMILLFVVLTVIILFLIRKRRKKSMTKEVKSEKEPEKAKEKPTKNKKAAIENIRKRREQMKKI